MDSNNEFAGWQWAYDNLKRGIKTQHEVETEAERYPLTGFAKGARRAVQDWREEQEACNE